MSDSLAWSVALLHSLYQSGVRHAVISPGSRSTPLTLAAAIHPGIEKHIVLDERSAGFMALGIGKSAGMPAALICTSGTAVTNYMPAVTEAKESGVPMILLTADRPPHLRNLGSSQTVDQIKLFGDQAVFFHEAGEPENCKEDIRRIEYLAKQAVEISVDSGGAAHLNFPFRKPLEPTTEAFLMEKKRLEEMDLNQTPEGTQNRSSIQLNHKVSELISSSKRPVIVASPANPHQALVEQLYNISSYLNAPVLAEPGSTVQGFDNQITRFDSFIRNKKTRRELKPDLILRFGDQPYSSSLLWALKDWKDVPLIHFSARRRTQDHAMSVNHKVVCQNQDMIDIHEIPSFTNHSWIEKWLGFEKESTLRLRNKIDQTERLTDGHIFHYVSNQLPNEWNVMLSNSLPARDMLTFGESKRFQFVNRGAAGIDGIMSTALGIHFSSERPTCCFIGDLAFLHDNNALYTMQQIKERAFIVIVVNNSGGNIFQMLPIYRNHERAIPGNLYETYFQTPQSVDISYLAKASDINYQKIESLEELHSFDLKSVKGSVIIECVTDSKSSMEQRIDIVTP